MLEDLKEYLGGIVIAVLIIAAIALSGVFLTKTVFKWQTEAEREVFKETTTYNEAAATFLADSYRQYNEAETDADKETIMQYVVMRYPNLDASNIDNVNLRRFYNKCLGID